MKGKIITVAYAIFAIAIIYWSFPIIKERYFSDENTEDGQEATQKSSREENASDVEDEDYEEETAPEENAEEDNSFLDVVDEDCSNQCADFQEEADIEYCKNVCGLSSFSEEKSSDTAEKVAPDGCDKLEGLKKDYCFKEKAITQKDFAICEKIFDAKIQESCNNRLTEEVLNGGGMEF